MSDETIRKMLELSDCLCQAVRADANVPDLCYCGVMPGAQTMDLWLTNDGDCAERQGQAWVRLTSAYNSTSFPSPDVSLTNCDAGKDLAYTFEIGIRRDFSVENQEDAPTAAELFTATDLQMREMELMRDVVTCCLPGYKILQNYTPYGPQGGVIGGSWLVSVFSVDA